MKNILLTAVALSFCINVTEAEPTKKKVHYRASDDVTLSESGDEQTSIYSINNNYVTYKYYVPLKVINQSPEWKEGENPPLTMKEAVQKALTYGKTKVPKLNQTHITRIELSKFNRPIPNVKKTWYYTVNLDHRVCRKLLPNHFIIVMIDGTVVKPTRIGKSKLQTIRSRPPKDANEKMSIGLDLTDLPLRDVVTIFEEQLATKFIIAPKVKGTVTCNINENVTRKELWEIFRKIL